MKATLFYEVTGLYVDPNTHYLHFRGREDHPEGGIFNHHFNLAGIIRYHDRLSADGKSLVVTIYFMQEERDRRERLKQEQREEEQRLHPEEDLNDVDWVDD